WTSSRRTRPTPAPTPVSSRAEAGGEGGRYTRRDVSARRPSGSPYAAARFPSPPDPRLWYLSPLAVSPAADGGGASLARDHQCRYRAQLLRTLHESVPAPGELGRGGASVRGDGVSAAPVDCGPALLPLRRARGHWTPDQHGVLGRNHLGHLRAGDAPLRTSRRASGGLPVCDLSE